jgi:hypothetical protein
VLDYISVVYLVTNAVGWLPQRLHVLRSLKFVTHNQLSIYLQITTGQITNIALNTSKYVYIHVTNGGFKNYAALYGNGKHRFHQQRF